MIFFTKPIPETLASLEFLYWYKGYVNHTNTYHALCIILNDYIYIS